MAVASEYIQSVIDMQFHSPGVADVQRTGSSGGIESVRQTVRTRLISALDVDTQETLAEIASMWTDIHLRRKI